MDLRGHYYAQDNVNVVEFPEVNDEDGPFWPVMPWRVERRRDNGELSLFAMVSDMSEEMILDELDDGEVDNDDVSMLSLIHI